jgi:hypothetical protein
VQEIEQTREDLADTLDAIVDKVSPKRVMDRTKEQARSDAQDALQTVKESAATAAQTVKEKALHAADAVKEQVASVKERVAAAPTRAARPDRERRAGAAGTSASSRRLSAAPAGRAAGGPDERPLPGIHAGRCGAAGRVAVAGGHGVAVRGRGGHRAEHHREGPDRHDGTTGTTGAAGATSASSSTGTGSSVVPTSMPSPVLPPTASSKAPLVAGASAAVAVLLLLLRRRRR